MTFFYIFSQNKHKFFSAVIDYVVLYDKSFVSNEDLFNQRRKEISFLSIAFQTEFLNMELTIM